MSGLWPATSDGIAYISQPPSRGWVADKKRLTILGSTGSIGTSALKVVAAAPERFEIIALAGARNVRKLAEQALRWHPKFLGVLGPVEAEQLQALLPPDYKPEIVTGTAGYAGLAALPEVNTVLSAQVGAAGLRGTVAAAVAGKVICLANKESLVLAGGLVRKLCARTGAVVLPVDSEHNAIFRCLAGRPGRHVKNIILTASGGPFYNKTRKELAGITREQALKHPNWSMGAKITIDSATLMNKGLEVIEAWHLYGVPDKRIRVLVHPQSLVHSLVEYQDGSLIADLGTPDMRTALAACLAWPDCIDSGVAPLDLTRAGALTFLPPDEELFPCFALARRVLGQGMEQAIILNAANEVAVGLFLNNRCHFPDIPVLVRRSLTAITAPGIRPLPENCPAESLTSTVEDILQDIEAIDRNTRSTCLALAEALHQDMVTEEI